MFLAVCLRYRQCLFSGRQISSIPWYFTGRRDREKFTPVDKVDKITFTDELPLWTSGTKCLYCVSNLSNLGLKLLKKISILSQTCLGQNVSIWSQFETFLTFEIQLRLSLFESNLRHFSALSKKCQKGLKNFSKRDLGGSSGWTVFSGT